MVIGSVKIFSHNYTLLNVATSAVLSTVEDQINTRTREKDSEQ